MSSASEAPSVDPTALLFPGQGSQRVGMGARLVAEHAVARATMVEADEALEYPLTRLCFEGPEAELTRTEFCQPAILAVSVATWRALGPASGIAPRWVAGHSLGEYTALVVAGALAFRDAVRLVRLRGRLMQSAVPAGAGTMAAIVGLEDARVAELCAAAAEGDVVSPANFNGAGQVVIAGHRAAVARATEAAKAAGARVVALAVSAPFHCALMTPVAAELARALAAVDVRMPSVPVVSNVEAALNADAARIRDLLVAQVTAPVRWAESMRLLRSLGCRRVVEVGPGQVLARIAQRMKLGLASASLEDVGGRAAEPPA
ncbi:MAG: ACP S-malonyltransferase [Deltaproteobacteria bacterium]|nr:ACP S-malonyltransferase [Deltaproteobacteria bacterium]